MFLFLKIPFFPRHDYFVLALRASNRGTEEQGTEECRGEFAGLMFAVLKVAMVVCLV